MAVAGVCHAKPIQSLTFPFNPDALVVGGGVAGMSAALGMASQGGNVYLVEREPELGGVGNKVFRTLDGELVAPHLGAVDQTGSGASQDTGSDRYPGGGPQGPHGRLHDRACRPDPACSTARSITG